MASKTTLVILLVILLSVTEGMMMATLRSTQLDLDLGDRSWESKPDTKAKQQVKLPMGLFPGSLYVSPVTVHQWKWLESAPAARDSLGLINWPQEDAEDGGSFLRLDSSAASKLELADRTPEHSRVIVNFSFGTDELLQLEYIDHKSEVSIQRLLQDIDCMAGYVCRKHCLDEGVSRPLLFYTALLDRLVVHKPLRCDTDMKLVGEVVWAGRSSLTVRVQALQLSHDDGREEEAVVLDGRLSFVARDRITGSHARVNGLLVSEQDENKNMSSAAALKAYYTELVMSLLRQGKMLNSSSTLQDGPAVLVQDTSLESVFLAEPEHLNSQGIVFGGLLMARACDLAFCCAYNFVGPGVTLREIYRVKFFQAVKPGSLVRLKANVMYTDVERELIHVEVRVLYGDELVLLFTAIFSIPAESWVSVLPSEEGEARRVIDMLVASQSKDIYHF